MKPLGRNQGGYFGEGIPIQSTLRSIVDHGSRGGWHIDHLEAEPDCHLPVLHRPGSPGGPHLYLSTGIHGDEPAGPLAAVHLVAEAAWPAGAHVWMCPCLNPSGFSLHRRENRHGADLNRDYRDPTTPEVRSHVSWLSQLPSFDLALLMHEDWEADGFYLYELTDQSRSPLAEAIVASVAKVCPIASSGLIDGRPAREGIIRPHYDPAGRPDWPEAFYLREHKTRRLYNLESPSDFPMQTRVNALVTAVQTALACVPERSSR